MNKLFDQHLIHRREKKTEKRPQITFTTLFSCFFSPMFFLLPIFPSMSTEIERFHLFLSIQAPPLQTKWIRVLLMMSIEEICS